MSIVDTIEAKNAFIDSVVAQFERDVAGFTAAVLDDLKGLVRTGEISPQAIRAIFTANGYEELTADFVAQYNELFSYASKLGDFKLTEQSLTFLELQQTTSFSRFGTSRDAIADSIMQAAFEGRVEQKPFSQIVNMLQEQIDDAKRRVVVEAREGLVRFDRLVKEEQFRYAGVEKYIYFGPLDNVTRPLCQDILGDPRQQTGWTREEIAASGAGFITGGGWNCRHEWLPFVENG